MPAPLPINKMSSIPPLNPLRFIPANADLPTGYNTWAFDQGFFWQHIRKFFQTPVNYYQKVILTQKITIYFDTLATQSKVLILNSKGDTIFDSGIIVYTDSTLGNVDSYFGDQYYTYIYQFHPIDIPLDEGFYYVLRQDIYHDSLGNPDPNPLINTLFVSECIQVRAQWEKTLLFQYWNSENDYDVLWEPTSTPTPWELRVEADIDIDPGGHAVAFEDMFYQMQKLQDEPFRVGALTIGGEGGVPPWMLDKVNRILACSNFLIDGVQWQKEQNANWSFKKAIDYPMKSATIILRDNPDLPEWEYGNQSDPLIFRIHTDVYDDTHD